MGLEYTVLVHCLKKRIDDCYDDYIEGLLGLGAEQIIEQASEIVAMKEAHFEMCFWLEMSMCKNVEQNILIEKPIDRQDVITLLSLENPLQYLGYKWWFYTLGSKVDFHEFYRSYKQEVTI